MSQARDERRCKILWLTMELMVHVVAGLRDGMPGFRMEGLPDDWQAETVDFDFRRQAFGVIVSSLSFEPVEEGSIFPDLGVSVFPATPDPSVQPRPVRFREFL